MPIRITGMNSGLDTEAIVTQLVSAYSVKKDKYVKAQTKLSWKQDAWKSLNTKIHSFYKSLDNMRFSTNYNLKSVKLSDESKVRVSASSGAMNGTQSMEVDKIAKSGYLTGGKLKSGTNANSTLADLGFSGDGTIAVKVGNTTKNIKVNSSTKISDFVSSLNGAGVTASFDSKNGRIFVASKQTGVANDFSLTAGNAGGMSALSALGLNAKGSSADMAAYESFAVYAKGIDNGGNVVDYFQKNADGTLKKDANGSYLKAAGVTYDQTETENYIADIRSDAIDKAAENDKLNKQLGYANAYAGVQDIKAKFEASGAAAGDWDTFTKLLGMADPASVYVGADGTTYEADKVTDNGDGTYTYTEDDGTEKKFQKEDLTHGAIRLAEFEVAAGIAAKRTNEDGSTNYVVDSNQVNNLKNNLHTVEVYEAIPENAAAVTQIQDAYADGSLDGLKSGWSNTISENQAFLDKHALMLNDTESPEFLAGRVDAAREALLNPSYSEGANKVNAQDAVIILNGAEYTSSTNEIEVNGLTITALGETDGEVTLSVDNDVSGLYDKIKNFLKGYNELINEMTSLFNAESAKGYEPLTDDEKEAMTEKEIEKWEEKIKGSLLRRDDTLNGVLNAMTSAMSKQYNINGKNYSLASFGISTLGYLNAEKNEHYAYHIDGDTDDTITSSKTDKLMAALKNDPDSVVQFMQQLTSGLYDAIDKKMKSTSMKSIYNVYNDKEMASEYSDYTNTIIKWENKLSDMEDSYYKKFAAMETALAKLQSQQSALGNLFA